MESVQPPDPPKEIDWEKLSMLSAQHSVSNMAWYGLKNLDHDNKPPKEMLEKFRNDYNKAAGKEAMQYIMLEKILKTFEENHIPCIPLKGCLLKYLYPHPNMRLMADVDILFKPEQAEQHGKNREPPQKSRAIEIMRRRAESPDCMESYQGERGLERTLFRNRAGKPSLLWPGLFGILA